MERRLILILEQRQYKMIPEILLGKKVRKCSQNNEDISNKSTQELPQLKSFDSLSAKININSDRSYPTGKKKDSLIQTGKNT